MENGEDRGLIELALTSAGITLGKAEDTTSYRVDVKNRVTVHHELSRQRFEQPPQNAAKYRLFRPRAAGRALAEVRERHGADPEAFFHEHAPDYLRGAIASDTYDHDSAPLSYKPRTEKVLDRVDLKTCSRCSGKGSYSENRSESTDVTCPACGGYGGESVTKYTYSPGTTAHGAPYQEFQVCVSCAGQGKQHGPQRTWVETVTCRQCGGSGQIEKKFYRKERVFLADVVRSQFRREASFRWPGEIQRLIDHNLVSDEDLFQFCEKSGETCRMQGTGAEIDVAVNLAVERRKPEGDTTDNEATVSVLKLDGRTVLFSDKPVLDPYLKRLAGELGRLSWQEVKARSQGDMFLDRMIEHALARTLPEALLPKLGFMASRTPMRGLLRTLRRVERRQRVFRRAILTGLALVAAFVLIWYFDTTRALFRQITGF